MASTGWRIWGYPPGADTFIAGDLILVRTDNGLAAVEEPKSGERVVTRLGDAATAAAFVEERLSDYERMWDGCGCRIDYYGEKIGASRSAKPPSDPPA